MEASKGLAELERGSNHDDRELVAGGMVVTNGGGRSDPVASRSGSLFGYICCGTLNRYKLFLQQ